MSFSILTDTPSNLTKKQLLQNDIQAIPFLYFIDGKEYTCTDLEEFHDRRYFDALHGAAAITTSQISPGSYMEAMEPLLQQGQDVLYIGLSSGVSSSFDSAQIARKELLSRYPQRAICLVDSLGAGLGEGLLVLQAADLRRQGKTLEETEQALLQYRPRICQIFFVDDLKHLRRTGRISGVAAVVGSALGIKPMLKGSSEGKIVACGKYRGKRRIIQALAERYASDVTDASVVGITYTDSREDAELLASLIVQKHPPEQLLLLPHEPVTASHLGTGAVALFFVGDADVREK